MPTIKQVKAFKEVMGVKGGNISKAMSKAGYTKEVSKRTDKLTKTKGWNYLINKYLPEKDLTKAHRELMDAKRIEKTPFYYKLKDKEVQEIIEGEGFKFIGTKRFMTTAIVFFSVPDTFAKKNALDMAYKLRGLYAPEKHANINLNLNAEKR